MVSSTHIVKLKSSGKLRTSNLTLETRHSKVYALGMSSTAPVGSARMVRSQLAWYLSALAMEILGAASRLGRGRKGAFWGWGLAPLAKKGVGLGIFFFFLRSSFFVFVFLRE